MGLRQFVAVAMTVSALCGAGVGVGAYTLRYARGASYLTNDPDACANCHVMNDHYRGWTRGTHHAVAVCNDCHVPHDFLGKWLTKARNGWRHSAAFTTGRFHEPIQITPSNHQVTEQACRHCHQDMVLAIDHGGDSGEPLSCVRCHSSVGHLR